MLWNQYFPDDDEIVFDSQLFQKSLFVVPWVEYQIFRWFDNSLIPWYSDFVKQNVANIQIYIQIYKNIWNAATWKQNLSHIHHFIFLHSLSDFFFQCVILFFWIFHDTEEEVYPAEPTLSIRQFVKLWRFYSLKIVLSSFYCCILEFSWNKFPSMKLVQVCVIRLLILLNNFS